MYNTGVLYLNARDLERNIRALQLFRIRDNIISFITNLILSLSVPQDYNQLQTLDKFDLFLLV